VADESTIEALNRMGPAGTITFGQAWGAIGYGDPILTATVTGQQLHDRLEEQWTTASNGTVVFAPLAVSHNVRYSFDASRPVGNRVDPADVIINGEPLDVSRNYRLATTAYTFLGADGYGALGGYTAPFRHIRDFEGWIRYVREHPELSPSQLDRVTDKSGASTAGAD
jgi:5'-nucleotidase